MDMETGYGRTLDELSETVDGLINAGAVGMNLEDSLGPEGNLRPMEEQLQRIAKMNSRCSRPDDPIGVALRVNFDAQPRV
jgi:2-methylisocitrate lyase-like PEP mutase family enzyme